jgi:hypothetical protein
MNKLVKNLIIMLTASLAVALISFSLSNPGTNPIFGTGYILGQILLLTATSFIISGVPALIIWLNKRTLWSGFLLTLWIIWGSIVLLSLIGQMMLRVNS